jgi:hypothetical protein
MIKQSMSLPCFHTIHQRFLRGGYILLKDIVVGCNSWRAGGQQERLQYNGEAAWWKVIGVYIISADEKKLKLALLKRS